MLALWAFIPITMLSFYITPHPKITLSAPPRLTLSSFCCVTVGLRVILVGGVGIPNLTNSHPPGWNEFNDSVINQ